MVTLLDRCCTPRDSKCAKYDAAGLSGLSSSAAMGTMPPDREHLSTSQVVLPTFASVQNHRTGLPVLTDASKTLRSALVM